MATPKTVWGVDIGQVALKALKLRNVNGELQVEAFDIIEHPKILSQPDVDRKALIRSALEQFQARNNLADSVVAVSVPGQSSFTRFVKLPPVDAKKVPDIVRYEAEQQIPFPINDVIWRWQAFNDPDSPDMEVGIFAMKKVDIAEVLDRYTEVAMSVQFVQMAPLALYNFMNYDTQCAEGGATLLADVGADKTDLVVSDGPRMWTRTIQIGGNAFTEALVRSFKLSFSKAEKLKRTAASSKYARQIFQAMRPVFADLVQEIQRSIGFYTALHRDTRFKRLVGLGNGFRLPGLQKFLEQNLNMPVVKIDSYNKLTPSANVNAPAFTENVLSFAVSYGLALQGLGLSSLNTNLLPQEIAAKRVWEKKRPWFAAAAAALLLVPACMIYSQHRDAKIFADTDPIFQEAMSKARELERRNSDTNAQKNLTGQSKGDCEKKLDPFKYRSFWPRVQTMINQALTDITLFPDQAKAIAYCDETDASKRERTYKELANTFRGNRQMLVVDSMTSVFNPDVAALRKNEGPGATPTPAPAAAPSGFTGSGVAAKSGPGFKITITGHTPLSRDEATSRLWRMLPLMQAYIESERQNIEAARAADKTALQDPNSTLAEYLMPQVRFELADGDYDVSADKGYPSGQAGAPKPAAVMMGGVSNDPNSKGPAYPDPFFNRDSMGMDEDTSFTISIIVTLIDDKGNVGGPAPAAVRSTPAAQPPAQNPGAGGAGKRDSLEMN